MAARRLIAILLVLLFLSSLAAALAPVQDGTRSGSTSSSSTTTTEPPTLPEDEALEGSLVKQSVDASGGRPTLVRVRTGDRLELRVTSKRSGTVELEGLGPAEDVGPQQPAYFDVFLRDDGSFPVRFLRTGREIARIEVSPPRITTAAR